MNNFILSLCLIALSIPTYASKILKPFLTDGCTGYAEGTRADPNLWRHCCVEHDLYFWAGGSKEERKQTDLRLKSCVEKTGEIQHAHLIYLGVTLGGASPIQFKTKQWGHAFEEREKYLALSEAETSLVIHDLETQNLNIPESLIQSFKDQLISRLDAQ